jgi:hypothetical protein
MRSDEFEREIGLLKRTYGEKSYPQERAFALWNELKMFESDVVSAAIKNAIIEERSPPMSSTIKAYINAVNEKRIDNRRESIDHILNKLPYCKYCDSQGFFHAENIHTKSVYLFACDKCERPKILMGNYKDRPLYFLTKKYYHQYRIEKPSVRLAWQDIYEETQRTFTQMSAQENT